MDLSLPLVSQRPGLEGMNRIPCWESGLSKAPAYGERGREGRHLSGQVAGEDGVAQSS